MADKNDLQFKEFAEDSDMHGVKQLTRSSNGLVSLHLAPLF